jgi:hypothetical protein
MIKRDFKQELARFVKELDRGQKVSNAKKQPLERVVETPISPQYNIHMRSVPVGVDKVLVIGLNNMDEVHQWRQRLGKKGGSSAYGAWSLKVNDEGKTIQWGFYEVVPFDGKKHSVYENNKQLTKKEEVKKPEVVIEHSVGEEVKWHD